ncbi:MAG: prolipoprotein diacylglyceryl transferase [Armatimonadota bacterium]|nr:prolipoprotein diacylglyceryl transferase [Armatimonadota bacterium]MDR5696863.1 prolipoprotein diacylglyceryl transferase [Armatimonadota bacterium]
MHPTLFEVAGFRVSSFGLFLLAAFAAGVYNLMRGAQREGLDANEALDLALYAIIGGILGARAVYVAAHYGQYAAEPVRILQIWQDGGLVFYGALAGGLIVSHFTARRWGLGRFADLAAPAVAIGYAVAMVGALLAGMFNGGETDAPWAVEIAGVARHPTQIYLLAAAIGIYRVLGAVRRVRPRPGQVFLTFVFLLGLTRFVVEFFLDRELAPAVWGPFTLGQFAHGTVAILALLLLVARGGIAAQAMPPEPSPPSDGLEPAREDP